MKATFWVILCALVHDGKLTEMHEVNRLDQETKKTKYHPKLLSIQ